ncbi:MAG: transglycosylase domain-containing protein [Bacillota bacterium]
MGENGTRTNRKKKKKKLNTLRFIIVVVVFLALVTGGSVGGLVMASLKDMPAWDPKALEPNLPSYIYDKDGNMVTSIFVENRVPVQLDQVPPQVRKAFLAIEDVRFYDHGGLDIKRIIGAAVADVKAGYAAQGASTITQQLAKIAFLNPEKSLKRKIQEAAIALQLERKYTKDQLFEMYLNRIYFGEGAYGIQSAAQVYFGRPVSELELHEAALLAGLPKAPNNYSPYKNPEAALKRRNVVLRQMAENNFASEAEVAAAMEKPIELTGTKARNMDKYPYPYFVDFVTDKLLAKYGEHKVYKGGLKVYTTLDPAIQAVAEKTLADKKNYPKSKPDKNGVVQPQAAVVVLDPHTGHIKALVGGRDHSQKLQFNRATDAYRQPGSAFKPVVAYAPAIENGKSPGTSVEDLPLKVGSKEFKNYDGQYHGIVTYRTAVTHSYNIPAINVLKDTGITKSINFAKKLGITSFVSSKDNAKRNDENLSIALGGLTKGITPLELAGAYGAFANKGVYVEPVAIIKVTDRNDLLLDETDFKPKKKVAMKQTTAFLITDLLQSVVKRGTGTRAALGKRPVAGKTGTTSDYKDAWFAGYTPELVGVVWMGQDDPVPLREANGRGVTGGSFPAKIWKEVMGKALKDTPVKEFESPDGLIRDTICSISGDQPGPNCPKDDLVTEWFVKGKVPSKVCEVHVLVEVCAESNQLPNEYCPTKVSRAFVKGAKDSKDAIPTETCTIHGPGTAKPSGTPVCTDPAHGGVQYLANIAGPGQDGGCPSQYVSYRDFNDGMAPTQYCPVAEHQVSTKEPAAPGKPDSPRIDKPDAVTPNRDNPNKGRKRFN